MPRTAFDYSFSLLIAPRPPAISFILPIIFDAFFVDISFRLSSQAFADAAMPRFFAITPLMPPFSALMSHFFAAIDYYAIITMPDFFRHFAGFSSPAFCHEDASRCRFHPTITTREAASVFAR
jgi:hypothetical protein